MVSGIEIYADGADLESIERLSADARISGFTSNPSLCRAAGVSDYREFCRKALHLANGKPVSLEVFSDGFDEMERQAHEIAALGSNAVVKIPITNSEGEFSGPVLARLARAKVPVNVTAIMTLDQVRSASECVSAGAILSVFAGRIADTGIDPESLITRAAVIANECGARILWASVREPFNVIQAQRSGADIITVPVAMLPKLDAFGRNLDEYSLETVRQFKKDAEGFTL